jgi:hypothetical protein
MTLERLLPADALRPRWSSESALVYIGAAVALIGLLGGRFGRLHGNAEA